MHQRKGDHLCIGIISCKTANVNIQRKIFYKNVNWDLCVQHCPRNSIIYECIDHGTAGIVDAVRGVHAILTDESTHVDALELLTGLPLVGGASRATSPLGRFVTAA